MEMRQYRTIPAGRSGAAQRRTGYGPGAGTGAGRRTDYGRSGRGNSRSAAVQNGHCHTRRRRRRRSLGSRLAGFFFGCAAAAALGMALVGIAEDMHRKWDAGNNSLAADRGAVSQEILGGGIQEELLRELLEKNEETLDYVSSYPDREAYMGQEIDLSCDFTTGEVPLLMQWDKRWGYDSYGDEMIGIAGCGPVCLDMAYLYFTGDLDMNPRKMAQYAWDRGFYTQNGTSWSLWTEGAAGLGLTGEVLPLDENRIKQTLDSGGLVVCSMGPGDFTTKGHFILIRGYDENGFYVNDPNRRSNSEKVWDFDTLRYQIKNLWGLSR